jgi:hypothetical protein
LEKLKGESLSTRMSSKLSIGCPYYTELYLQHALILDYYYLLESDATVPSAPKPFLREPIKAEKKNLDIIREETDEDFYSLNTK